jgi:hypothetical protein
MCKHTMMRLIAVVALAGLCNASELTTRVLQGSSAPDNVYSRLMIHVSSGTCCQSLIIEVLEVVVVVVEVVMVVVETVLRERIRVRFLSCRTDVEPIAVQYCELLHPAPGR